MDADVETTRNGQPASSRWPSRRSSRATRRIRSAQGGLCARGQASIQLTYHPDRLVHPMKRTGARGSGEYKEITWDEGDRGADRTARHPGRRQGPEIGGVPHPASSRPSHGARRGVLERVRRRGADHLRALRGRGAAAGQWISFGREQLPTIDLARSRFAMSFGADFLGTWNSPVAQSAGLRRDAAGRPRVRGAFVQARSRMSSPVQARRVGGR